MVPKRSFGELELPRALLHASDRDLGSAREVWLAELPVVVAEAAERWSLGLGSPFQPGGSASWVAPARTSDGAPAVLKVGWRHDESQNEADGLRAWAGRGAVRLLDGFETATGSVLLLEACEPGSPLTRALPDEEQDVVVAGLLRQLWRDPGPGGPFRPLKDMCEAWGAQFDERYADEQLRLDPGLVRAGLDLFRNLPDTADRSVLLCTDLHSGNVLAAAREPWLVIDPKPFVGDPTYDPLQYMLNFPHRLAADASAFARRMAELCGLDTERLRLWLFARCVQGSISQPELAAVASQLAP